jgi:hypothetical protein
VALNRRVEAISASSYNRASSQAAVSMEVPMKKILFALTAMLLAALAASPLLGQQTDSRMSFFLTSVGPGKGADLGGLAGADAYCQRLAASVGVGGKTWHAYLSAAAADGQPAVDARDRIGNGPWYNAKGVKVADSVANLHSESNNLTKETVLNEKGEVVNGRGDDPNRHDILTGSNLDGTLFSGEGEPTCGNWTKSGEGSARVGHHDRQGGGDNPTSWNSAHSTSGCSQEDLRSTGGDGLFYCFATN